MGRGFSSTAGTFLDKYTSWIAARHLPFLVSSIGMIVMLLWAGTFKMTIPGADGIVPLVTHSPIISWHFRVFGTYVGSDLIGATEWTAAILLLVGYRWPEAGIIGATIATGMFIITSSMLLTTPGTFITVHGIKYMSFLGLFLYKDIISIGVSLYLAVHFRDRSRLFAHIR